MPEDRYRGYSMAILSELSALAGLADRASEQIEYWREFEGDRILITHQTVERITTEHGEDVKITNYVIEGDIDDVMSFPPEFRLKNVREYLDMADYSLSKYSSGVDAVPGVKLDDEETVKKIDEKFVSFSSIEQIERMKHRDGMSEPILDKIDDRKYISDDEFSDATDRVG
jgi:hypothetical protein